MATKKKKTAKTAKTTDLKKELDTWFSRFIRLRDSGRCVTCGKVSHWKEMQNGHYISRTYLATRWDERNNNCQCVGCNIYKNGNMDEYALFMLRTHGIEVMEDLKRLKNKIVKLTPQWYQIQIDHYKELVATMLEEIGE